MARYTAKKRYKSPKDLRRDHRNFTNHLAGNRQIEFENFDKEDTGMFNVGVEANNHNMIIRRPKGRLTFNSNLLTAGQVKFSNHDMSNHVRTNLRNKLSKRSDEENTVSVHNSATSIENTSYSYWGYDQATKVYDAVYNILENYRSSRKAAKHFDRKAILKNHLKDVNTSEYGYETVIGYEENVSKSSSKSVNGEKGVAKRGYYDKDELNFEVNWAELRKYIYGFIKKSEIKNPIIESIVKRHEKVLQNSIKSTNNVAPIHAALSVALDFEMTAQQSFGNSPNGRVQTNSSTSLTSYDGNKVYDKTKLDHDADDLDDLQEQITNDAIDDYNKEQEQDAIDNSLNYIPIDPNDDDSWDKNRKQREVVANAKRLNIVCGGWIMGEDRDYFLTETHIDLSTISLDEEIDRNNTTKGSSGYRPIRNSWRLPILGDVNVFKKHPVTNADLITLIDGSGSMGEHIEVMIKRWGRNATDEERERLRRDGQYSHQPIRQASDMVAAIKKRFPDSKAFVFGNTDEKDPIFKAQLQAIKHLEGSEDREKYREYHDKHRKLRWSAGLYEIKDGQFPDFPSSGTPLCGSLKALEDNFSLDHARIIIATDGDANQCSTGDPYECVYSILDSWRNKGVRIATLWTPNFNGQRMPRSLHGDVTIEIAPSQPITDAQIKQIFSFIKG